MDQDFAGKYLDAIGYGRVAHPERLRPVLTCEEMAKFMVYGDLSLDEIAADPGDDLYLKMRCVYDSLIDDCRMRVLKASIPADLPPAAGAEFVGRRRGGGFLIHCDDARRYFASLDISPPDGSEFARWLRGSVDPSDKQSICSQDKADFQQRCLVEWERNPTQTITGPAGVVQAVGEKDLRLYKLATLEKWAREIAPEHVRGRRGRPKKSAGTEK